MPSLSLKMRANQINIALVLGIRQIYKCHSMAKVDITPTVNELVCLHEKIETCRNDIVLPAVGLPLFAI